MFSRMTKPYAQAIVQEQVVIERADIRQLIRERRMRFFDTGFELPPNLTRHPGSALRTAPHHDGISP
jgi:hypothetical protein